MVPNIRRTVKEFADAPLADVLKLLRSPFHEERLLALLLLVRKFEKGDDGTRKRIYTLYLKNTKYINNWDLVDLSAPKIVGPYLEGGSRSLLYRLSGRRISGSDASPSWRHSLIYGRATLLMPLRCRRCCLTTRKT